MQSRDWDELQRLMSIARQQNLLGEALQCVEQAPLAPIPRAVAKAKAVASVRGAHGAAGSGGTDGALANSVIGGMSDASKRRLPEDSDGEPIDGPETLSTTAQVAEFVEENLHQWYPPLEYDGGSGAVEWCLWPSLPMAQASSKMWFAWHWEEVLSTSSTYVSSKRSSRRRYQMNRHLKALTFVPFSIFFVLSLHLWYRQGTKGPIDEMRICGESAMYGLHCQVVFYDAGCIGVAISAGLESTNL